MEIQERKNNFCGILKYDYAISNGNYSNNSNYSQILISQETEMTSTPTRPVDNVVIATKGLQDRNINILTGTTVENKGKLILMFYVLYIKIAILENLQWDHISQVKKSYSATCE
jgi:hypothetical protein